MIDIEAIDFGGNVRRIREAKGLTCSDIDRLGGLSNSYTNKIERQGADSNPTRLLEPVANMLEYDELLMVCLTLLDACDAVQMLPGWKNSRGARIEFKYALGKSMDIYAEED